MERVQQFEAHVSWVNAMQFSSDGALIVTGGEDGAVRVWDAKSGQRISTLGHHSGGVTSIALYPDASRALSVGDDGRIKSWAIPAARGEVGPKVE
jgi:WD40 repeat protein